MRTIEGARALALALEAVGAHLESPVVTVLTSMEEPLGRAAGNALEVEEAIRTLRGDGPGDLEILTHRLVGEMLRLARLVETVAEGAERSRLALSSGRAMERFERIAAAQGGRLDRGIERYGLPGARFVRFLESPFDGYVSSIDARAVGEIVRGMGGGRYRPGDRIDPSVGLRFLKKRGERVSRGEHLVEIHAAGEEDAERAARSLVEAYSSAQEPPPQAPLFL
jgi:thymidine phosphorylase